MNNFLLASLLLTVTVVHASSLPPTYDCTDENHHGHGYYVDVTDGCTYYHHCEIGQGVAIGIKCFADLKVDLGANAGENVDECWPLCAWEHEVKCLPEYDGARLTVVNGECKLIPRPDPEQ